MRMGGLPLNPRGVLFCAEVEMVVVVAFRSGFVCIELAGGPLVSSTECLCAIARRGEIHC